MRRRGFRNRRLQWCIAVLRTCAWVALWTVMCGRGWAVRTRAATCDAPGGRGQHQHCVEENGSGISTPADIPGPRQKAAAVIDRAAAKAKADARRAAKAAKAAVNAAAKTAAKTAARAAAQATATTRARARTRSRVLGAGEAAVATATGSGRQGGGADQKALEKQPIASPPARRASSSLSLSSSVSVVGRDGLLIPWQNDVLPPPPAGSRRVHLCGLQRTGTNLLASLLNHRDLLRRGLWYQPRTNAAAVRGTPPWKHFRLFEDAWRADNAPAHEPPRPFSPIRSASDYDRLLQVDSNVSTSSSGSSTGSTATVGGAAGASSSTVGDSGGLVYVVAVKDPFAWFVSVCEFWSSGGGSTQHLAWQASVARDSCRALLRRPGARGTRRDRAHRDWARDHDRDPDQDRDRGRDGDRERRRGHIARGSLGGGNPAAVTRPHERWPDAPAATHTNRFVAEYVDLFNNYYRRWLAVRAASPGRVLLVKYEDVLRDCPAVLDAVRALGNISDTVIRPSFCETRRTSPAYGSGGVRLVGHRRSSGVGGGSSSSSSKLWDAKKARYLNGEYLAQLWPEDASAIAARLDPEVRAAFGYELPPTPSP